MVLGDGPIATQTHSVGAAEAAAAPIAPAFVAIEDAASFDLVLTVEVHSYQPPVLPT